MDPVQVSIQAVRVHTYCANIVSVAEQIIYYIFSFVYSMSRLLPLRRSNHGTNQIQRSSFLQYRRPYGNLKLLAVNLALSVRYFFPEEG